MNKALDYNKLQEQWGKGKLLKKVPRKLYYVSKKMDGHYTTVVKHLGKARYYSSSFIEYFPVQPTWLDNIEVPTGVYICERAVGGKLGDRTLCSLTGPQNRKEARATHEYLVHDHIPLDVFNGSSKASPYARRVEILTNILRHTGNLDKQIEETGLKTLDEAQEILAQWVKQGYEGIMLKSPDWVWKDTTSRTVDLMKWKARPTADLFCIRTNPGEDKYEGLIGSLLLQDSMGRLVSVGSGMSDEDRARDPEYFIGKVVEVEYEQILDTYVQATFGSKTLGVTIRDDKGPGGID